MSLLSLVRSRSTAVIVTAVVVTAGFQIAEAVAAPQAPSAPVTVTREPLRTARRPRCAAQLTLGLSRVTVMPGTTLALHHHPGTQIGYVDSGVLTYTVEQGRAPLLAATRDGPRHESRRPHG